MSPPIGPYTPVRRVGDWVITSGQIGLATDGGGVSALVDGGTLPQLRQALNNLAAVLEGEGVTLRDVVKTTLSPRHGRVRRGQRGVDRVLPRAADPIGRRRRRLAAGARVEVEAWAYVPTAG